MHNRLLLFAAPPTIMPFLFPNSLLNEGMRSAVSCQVRSTITTLNTIPLFTLQRNSQLNFAPRGIH